MAGRPNRGLDPTRVNICKDCARDVLPTDLGVAEHRAYHLEAVPFGATPTALIEAWRSYAHQLETQASELRRRLADRDDVIANLDEDIYRLGAALADLRAELP